MFELTSEFGDIYNGHIIRINKDKLVLLLASTHYSDMKITQTKDDLANVDAKSEQQSTIVELISDYVREYLQTNHNHFFEQIRRVQVELEPLTNTDKRRVIIHLLNDEEIVEKLTFDITYEQEPKLFDKEYQNNLYFIQSINETTIINSVEHKLKELFDKRYSLKHQDSYIQLTLDIEYDTLASIRKMFYAYANHTLSIYSREGCMRIAIEYYFDDLLDKFDCKEFQPINDTQIQMMIDDVQMRLRQQIERRLKAEMTAKILLIGPPINKEIKPMDKEVIVLDHHREIFINQSDTSINPSKVKDIQHNNDNAIFHEEIDGGPQSFDRLPMSIDSLTILRRFQHRKHLSIEQNDNKIVLLGSGIQRLVSSKDSNESVPFSTECEQDKVENKSTIHVNQSDSNRLKTLNTISIHTKSYNTSAYPKKFHQQHIKKRISRSPAEYGKHKHKRRRHTRFESRSKACISNRNVNYSFLNNLCLLYQNKKQKTMKKHNKKQKQFKSAKHININATKRNSTTTNLRNDLIIESTDDLSKINELMYINLPNSSEEQQLLIKDSNTTTDSISLQSMDDNIKRQYSHGNAPLYGQFKINKEFEEKVMKQSIVSTDFHMNFDEKDRIDYKNQNLPKYNRWNERNELSEQQQLGNDGFQEEDDMDDDDSFDVSEENCDTERYLHSLYGSLSSTIKHVHEIYQSKSSQLKSSMELAHIFINFIFLRKDIAYEIASIIIAARRHLLPSLPIQTSSSTSVNSKNRISMTSMNDRHDADDTSISFGMVSVENSDTMASENSSTTQSITDDDKDHNISMNIIRRKKYDLYKNKTMCSLKSPCVMSRITNYLSKADWRVFNYITKYFLQNGTMITSHALEFSSALLIDLIEDSVYQTYFHLNWCSDTCLNSNEKNSIENMFIEEFFKKSINNLYNHLQLINSPLLENIALIHILKKYMTTDLLQKMNSKTFYPVPTGHDPCIWFSTDILIKTVCSLTDDIFNQMNHDYLADYTKLEYLLISYFHKIEIGYNLQDLIEKNRCQTTTSSHTFPNNKYLLHIIDLNQAPKFFSDQAFKQFKLEEHNQLNNDIEAFKDLFLLDIQKHDIKLVKRPYVPLCINDLIIHQQKRVLSPSPWISTHYHRQQGTQKSPHNEYNVQKDSYQFDKNIDFTKSDNLPPEVQAIVLNMMNKYRTIEDQFEGLSEKDVAQLIENAIEAVEKFDHENNIGDRKLQNKKTINDRLAEFFKYSGQHGIRLLDDVLKMAKLRSNDPKKYIPIAVNILKDRLKQNSTIHQRKQGVRFAHTLKTLLIATNDEPELITTILKKKKESQKSSKEYFITEIDSLQKTSEEFNREPADSLIDSVNNANIPLLPVRISATGKYQQSLPSIDEAVEFQIPSNVTAEINVESDRENLLSIPSISNIGLTIAQLAVLISLQNQVPLKLTMTQIEQICLKQGLHAEQLEVYFENLIQTIEIPDKFQLTEEQLNQIVIEENIPIHDVDLNETSMNSFDLNEKQIQFLIAQIDMMNWLSLSPNFPFKQQQLPLILHLNQLIELCNQQHINIDKLLNNQTDLQNSLSPVNPNFEFTFSPSQIAYIINQHNFDIKKLLAVQQNLKKQDSQTQQFHLNISQLAYLFLNRHIIHSHEIVGLSASQLIALYMLPQSPIQDDQTSFFSLTYQQIKQLALMQNMSLEHLQALPTSNKPLQLSHNQLVYIAMENKITIKQITSLHSSQKSKILTHKQLCTLINQNSQSTVLKNSINLRQSTDESSHIPQYVCLNMTELRLKPEQLAMLWNTDILSDVTSVSQSQSRFTLTDEQFSSLLRNVSISIPQTPSQLTTNMKFNTEASTQLHEPSNNRKQSTDKQNLLSFTLTEQLTAMHKQLQSSVQTHIETVKLVSDSILKRNQIKNTLNLIHQLSLHSIDDISMKEIETIPSFVLDLLKMNTITENIYQSIKQGEVVSNILEKSDDLNTNDNLNKIIIEKIQTNQLSLSQIHKIQTELLTPKLMNEFKTGHLSQRILNAYKSQSPLQMIQKIRTSITQLSTLLLHQSSIIAQPDAMIVPIMLQSTMKNTIPSDEISDANASNNEKNEHAIILPQVMEQDPIIIYPESPIIRQQTLQELGNVSIRHITNKIRTMAITKDFENLINRQIDEVDILNILEGHISHFFDQVHVDTNKINELFNLNIQHRLNRVNERIQLVNILQNHIEYNRLKRQMNLEEFTAFVLEDISKFEQLTNIHLTEDDLRIISMNRFASIERLIMRRLTEAEYRYLLQTNSPFDYIEKELLKRPLTTDEHTEQEELTILLYQDVCPVFNGKILDSLEQQNIKLTHIQLEQILRRRAELVDDYDIIYSITPSIQLIEEQLDHSLTMSEKKRLIHDDYSVIEQIKDSKRKTQEILPLTALILNLIENTQDKNLLENIEQLQVDIDRSLTKHEIIMAANGDIIGLEKTLDRSLPRETIKSLYNNRFIDLTNELNRDLTDKEIRDILNGQFNGIEKALGHQLTSTERSTYKPLNIIDMAGSQLTNKASIDGTIEELEDVLDRRLTLPEIEYITDRQSDRIEKDIKKDLSSEDLNIKQKKQIHLEENLFIFGRILKQPIIYFTLTEIEKAIGKHLNTDELRRFAGLRFVQIESDLGKSLTDLQLSNLLEGNKLTIESLIGRKLTSEETGPHMIDITNIEKTLNRSLTMNELTNLADDRFDEICLILQRSLTQKELIDLLNGNYDKITQTIDDELNRQKENELKELPINRLRYFENILHRQLSSDELLRFAEARFKPILHLFIDGIESEQILDLASGYYNKIETILNCPFTFNENYELQKSLLQVHGKYLNILDELEFIIQRKLDEQELKRLFSDQYNDINKRLNRSLTEQQLRNIIYGIYDGSLIEIEDLLKRLREQYEDNRKRTQYIISRLIKKLDENKFPMEKDLIQPSSIQQEQSNIEFQETTTDLLEQLPTDIRQDHLKNREELLLDDNNRTSMHEIKPIKAFENITRLVEQIADKEHIEELTTVTNAIDKFQEKTVKNNEKSPDVHTTLTWLSNLNKDTTTPYLPSIKSQPNAIHNQTKEDVYLGWTLFKDAIHSDVGLTEEKPAMINVKHIAQTYVVGIPEEYADTKSKIIANKIYRGESIIPQLPKSRILKQISEFISQIFHMPIINDATHFIVPSRGYIDIIEPMNTYESEIIDIKENELEMRDSPETLEWYEECIQRNVQVHAQIPLEYQPSIVYCHTGRQTVITPAKRAAQRRMSVFDQLESNIVDNSNISTLNNDSIEQLDQPMFDNQSKESKTTVTDLIMHTVTISKKTDLLEALEDLFSQENLDKYPMTETHWQDLFLILLNSYLHSNSLNRKDIFQRLTDKLHELKKKERRRSSGLYPNISAPPSPIIQITNSLNETKQNKFHFGLRSSFDSIHTDRSPNSSQISNTPLTSGQTSHETIHLLSNNNSSTGSITKINTEDVNDKMSLHSQSHMDKVTSSNSIKQHQSINLNATNEYQHCISPKKHRRYKITVMHSDEPLNISSNQCQTTTKSVKLPSIVSKKNSSKVKQAATSLDYQLKTSTKQTRTKIVSNFHSK
ncbi:unnamed protein product [Adineta steineri]|uniref:Uncharacterized protein n=3 Tax=Adineta steineri TaxID=433720 RepID=A0A813QPF3_9BILA|nr:unnamed protein product [Adineta steineri]